MPLEVDEDGMPLEILPPKAAVAMDAVVELPRRDPPPPGAASGDRTFDANGNGAAAHPMLPIGGCAALANSDSDHDGGSGGEGGGDRGRLSRHNRGGGRGGAAASPRSPHKPLSVTEEAAVDPPLGSDPVPRGPGRARLGHGGEAADGLGRGRGRGATLPAWMVARKNGASDASRGAPGGLGSHAQNYPLPVAAASDGTGAAASGVVAAAAATTTTATAATGSADAAAVRDDDI